ncbi:MAG: hypothetical protein KFF68_17440, partial [Desulfosarcina sp.]|nr:hypothetical protein [Desulfosarcina sp.]
MKKSLLFISVMAVLSLIGFGVVQSRTSEKTIGAAGDDKGASSATASPVVPQAKPLPAVRVETVTPQQLSRTAALTGAVVPTRTARLASPGEGPVEA